MFCIIISVFIYAVLNFIVVESKDVKISAKLIQNEYIAKMEIESIEENTYNNLQTKWSLEIPKINLKAPISEGTDDETLNQYIGHFEETSLLSRKYWPCCT